MYKKPNRDRVRPDAENQGENQACDEIDSDVHDDAMCKMRRATPLDQPPQPSMSIDFAAQLRQSLIFGQTSRHLRFQNIELMLFCGS